MKRKNKHIRTIGSLLILIFSGIVILTSFKPDKEEGSVGVIQMTRTLYLEKIYDFEKSPKKFKYKGKRVAVIDFYADWCRPCRRVAPIMDELAKRYEGSVDFYKVNVDSEGVLASIHQVESIPMVILLSPDKQPRITTGALNKEEYIALIEQTINKQ